jgi:predicted nucleotidyltransferase
MIPEAAQIFADACQTTLADRISSITLVGSFARGDQRPTSDIDLMVLVDAADRSLLDQIGSIVAGIETPNELNPAVLSLEELSRHAYVFDWLMIKHDGIPVYGQSPDIVTCHQTELDQARQIAQEVLMSARHYLAVQEPADKFAGGKLHHWNLKPLSFAVRFYEFHKTGRYIRSPVEIAQLYPMSSRKNER